MRRGDLITIALQGDYGKPRPALVIQSDYFDMHPSVTVMPVTSELRDTPLFRYTVMPDEANGLRCTSQVMIDKIVTVSREKTREPFGRLDAHEMLEIERLMSVFLGLA